MTDLAVLATKMNAGQPPRVWSLLVTVFGDLAQGSDARLRGTHLGRITDPLGVKPEALRVALHRLRKEGWITSTREGRISFYELTPAARSETKIASKRIYDFSNHSDAGWLVITDPSAASERLFNAKPVAPNIFISSSRADLSNALSVRLDASTQLPGWMSSTLIGDDIITLCAALSETLVQLPGPGELAPDETAALRVAVIHAWRRIVLRIPEVPDALFPADWQGAVCRARVATCLRTYKRPTFD